MLISKKQLTHTKNLEIKIKYKCLTLHDQLSLTYTCLTRIHIIRLIHTGTITLTRKYTHTIYITQMGRHKPIYCADPERNNNVWIMSLIVGRGCGAGREENGFIGFIWKWKWTHVPIQMIVPQRKAMVLQFRNRLGLSNLISNAEEVIFILSLLMLSFLCSAS